MKSIIISILLLFIGLNAVHINPQTQPDVKLLKYYSSLLTLNLNHAMDASKVLYHLSREHEFSKDLLKTVLERIKKNLAMQIRTSPILLLMSANRIKTELSNR